MSWRFRRNKLCLVISVVIIFILLNVIAILGLSLYHNHQNSDVCECGVQILMKDPTNETNSSNTNNLADVNTNAITGNTIKNNDDSSNRDDNINNNSNENNSDVNSKNNDTLICNKPYILVGNECCLDYNNNSICDSDDLKFNNSIILSTKEDKLREAGSVFGELFVNRNYSGIYDMLEEKDKKAISRYSFIKLFPPVVFGMRYTFFKTGEYTWRIKDTPYVQMLVSNTKIYENKGYVNYSAINRYNTINYTSEYFKLVNDSWKLKSLNYLVYGGCNDKLDCESHNDTLYPVCKDLCDNFRRMKLRKTDIYQCEDAVCYCKCWDKYVGIGTRLKPDYEIINEKSFD